MYMRNLECRWRYKLAFCLALNLPPVHPKQFSSPRSISQATGISQGTPTEQLMYNMKRRPSEFILHEQVHSPLDNKAVCADTYFAWSVRTKHSGVDLRPPTGVDLTADKNQSCRMKQCPCPSSLSGNSET